MSIRWETNAVRGRILRNGYGQLPSDWGHGYHQLSGMWFKLSEIGEKVHSSLEGEYVEGSGTLGPSPAGGAMDSDHPFIPFESYTFLSISLSISPEAQAARRIVQSDRGADLAITLTVASELLRKGGDRHRSAAGLLREALRQHGRELVGRSGIAPGSGRGFWSRFWAALKSNGLSGDAIRIAVLRERAIVAAGGSALEAGIGVLAAAIDKGSSSSRITHAMEAACFWPGMLGIGKPAGLPGGRGMKSSDPPQWTGTGCCEGGL